MGYGTFSAQAEMVLAKLGQLAKPSKLKVPSEPCPLRSSPSSYHLSVSRAICSLLPGMRGASSPKDVVAPRSEP